ncbi:hypothetical protein N7468_010021 [Penicillium chermesinum]|uniref:Ankyrin repeat protein n=1 Tax=Penicillium chermesinum TaxID=63820 RepID=A0A9W9NDU7_9EURO|nr:uncharacterized protein N7468_010021 [Penicillium chermesinum]KAJ5217013.1 hypothetical protein N7468_010021 [Penicillium chermesinum]
MEAIENRDLYLLKLLIEKSGGYVDFTQKDETGKTILDLASASGWPEGLEVLQQSSN